MKAPLIPIYFSELPGCKTGLALWKNNRQGSALVQSFCSLIAVSLYLRGLISKKFGNVLVCIPRAVNFNLLTGADD
jgi:hypothetical protein